MTAKTKKFTAAEAMKQLNATEPCMVQKGTKGKPFQIVPNARISDDGVKVRRYSIIAGGYYDKQECVVLTIIS